MRLTSQRFPAAGIQQRFLASSVVVSQGYPAGHLYLLVTGRIRRFLLTEEGQNIVLLRVSPGKSLAKRQS